MTPKMGGTAADTLRTRLDERLAARDKPGAVADALAAIESGDLDVTTLYVDVLSRLMIDVGSRWQAGTTCVWEEHLASSTVRTIVEALYPTVRRLADAVPASGRRVLLTCPPDEAHDLGLRMLSDRFELAGWTTYLLGPDAPGPEIVAAAAALDVELVVLTSSTHFHRMRVRALLDDVNERLTGVRAVVGGAAFTADTEGFTPDEILTPEEFFGAGTATGA